MLRVRFRLSGRICPMRVFPDRLRRAKTIGEVHLRANAQSFASLPLLAAIAYIALCFLAWYKPLRYAWRHYGLLVLDTSSKLFLNLNIYCGLAKLNSAQLCASASARYAAPRGRIMPFLHS